MPLCNKCDFEIDESTAFCPMCGVAQVAPERPPEHDSDELMAKMFEEGGEDSGHHTPESETPLESDAAESEAEAENKLDEADAPSVQSAPLEEFEPVLDEPVNEEIEHLAEEPQPLLISSEIATDLQHDNDIAPISESFNEQIGNAPAVSEPEDIASPLDPEQQFPVAGPIQPDIQEPTVSTNDFSDASAEDQSQAPTDPGQTATPLGAVNTDSKRSGLKPLAEGTLLNSRYSIVRKIGGGGMGAVYLACDQNLGGVERAVKEMVQSSIEEDQQNKAVEDFKRESTILSTLDHPSIPTIYDYFFDHIEGRFYLVMKYISGGDLAARLRSTPGGRIDERIVTEWAIQVADVLSYLHNLPTTIVYRDLKPSNIMLDSAGKVMLIDFGIARSINQQEKGVTAVGTMGYAPPELFSGQVEPRSDIYSLGSTMFHLLTGADPQNNPLLIFDFQKNPRPRQINPQLSDQMERILMRSVEYNAEHRFSSAGSLRQALVEHLDNLRSGQITFGVSEAPAAVSLANQSVFCGFCGQRIVATDMFCAFCGAKQPIGQQGVHAEIYPRTGVTAKLIIDGTSELDAPIFSLEKNENLLGRRDPQSNIFPEVDLSKYDPQTKISRRHARIWREGGGFMVEDLGSSNGTILVAGLSDSVRLMPRHPHPLSSGDRLRLGDTTLHFLMS
ncbi:MAG: FHA domain-containing serine/threonine-protein kinase [Pyrinomonadaceae bacterium]